MRNIIIHFTMNSSNFRLVIGMNTGRNDVEIEDTDRLGQPIWKSIGYDKSGMPSAEQLLQLALLRAFDGTVFDHNRPIVGSDLVSPIVSVLKDERSRLQLEIHLGEVKL